MWETPRNIALLTGAVAAVSAVIAGTPGYKLGSEPPRAIVVHLDAPLLAQPAPYGPGFSPPLAPLR
jgi:hypothetical protein